MENKTRQGYKGNCFISSDTIVQIRIFFSFAKKEKS